MPVDVLIGRVLLGRYRVQRALGAGAHGKVFLAEDLSRGSERVALKLVEGLVGGGDDEPGHAMLRWFRHPNWAEILDVGRYAAYDWFQAIRFVDGPGLDRLTGAQPVEWVWRFLEDGARVLRALHARGLIHYDVAPGNWLVEGGPDAPRFVLTDGGLAHEGPVNGFARGTPMFMAPEVTEDRRHDHRVDLYSLGLCAYRLATGADPLAGGAGDVLGRRRREPAPHARERRPALPPALDALMAALLEPDPNARIPNADDLLRRLGEARPEVAGVLPAEAVAASTGGALVGREAALQRFGASVRALAQHLPPGSTSAPHAGKPHEAVLLVAGPEGSGGTRLLREFAVRARREEVPFLVLAGRDGAPDRRDPLRGLIEGLTMLGAPAAPPQAAPAERAASTEPEVRAHVEGRAIERLLALADETARRSPFVLLVEDFAELPHLAQEAVRVLSRHLLGRAERATGMVLPPLLLVVDVGAGRTDPLVNPDAANPRQPVVELPPLTPDEVASLCTERFPGLSLAPEDRTALHRASSGRPAVVAALLTEGYRRGDLQATDTGWMWDLSRLASYEPARRLAPALQEALRSAGGPLRALVEQIALLEHEAPAAVVRALWSRVGTGDLPPTPLLSPREHGAEAGYALAAPSLRRVVLDETPADRRRLHAQALREALEAHPDPRMLVDRVTLRLDAGDAEGALLLAHEARATLDLDQRLALQGLLRRLVEHHPDLLTRVDRRHAIAELLDRGPDALAVARSLAGTFRSAADLPALLLVAHVIEEAQDFATLRTLLERHADLPDAPVPLLAELHVTLARVLFALRQPTLALAPLARAKRLLKSLGRSKREHPRLLIEFLNTVAKRCVEAGQFGRASRALQQARRAAKHLRQPHLYSQALGNEGLVALSGGDQPIARTRLEHALTLRRRIGDISGTVKLLHNLALTYLSAGLPALAAARLHQATGIAARHGLVPLLLDCLRLLASALDAQRSTAPALDCYARALRAANRAGVAQRACRIAHEMAPLAAAAGDPNHCRDALATAAQSALSESIVDARPLYHIAAARSAMALGSDGAAIRAHRRALRGAKLLAPANQLVLDIIGIALEGERAPRGKRSLRRPRLGQPYRHAFRVTIAVLRAGRARVRQESAPEIVPFARRATALSGDERRLAVEVFLGAVRRGEFTTSADLWNDLVDGLRSAAETQVLARAQALRSYLERALPAGMRADLFSRAVGALSAEQGLPRVLRGTPLELRSAITHHAERELVAGDLVGESLHSFAHRLLLSSGRPLQQDTRRADALHRVLAITARIEAGAKLEELLEAITRSTAQITGAQRACVVLAEPGSTPQMRVATSVTALGEALQPQDLSHTVIRRVLDARVPLLLHDAFGDEELLSRPSVTSLSLRSILCVPMLRNGELYGVMYADSSSSAGSFDQIDLEVLSLFAEQAAAAIDTSRMVGKLQTAYADLRSMQERLIRSERLRVIGEVSSGVAHEFNNLLTAILARVQLMGLNCPDREQRTHLTLIEKATLDAAGVVRRLQSFSREQRTGTFVAVAVHEICSDAIEFLRPLWGTRRRHGRPVINVRLHCEPGLTVKGNPTELREVMTNLVKNALDALAERGGTVHITATTPEEGRILVRVHDDGPGIPTHVLPHVFDPFFTTKGEGGTGLGLCLSQRIVEQHGGELTLESAAENGTTAFVRLPAAATAAPAPANGQRAAEGEPPGPAVRVLIVDDDADVLRPLCTYLERSGYAVVSAQDGSEALARLPASDPDVVLSDIGMPMMDGLELCRRVHALRPRLPVVLMSGWASEVDPAKARAVGAFALLAKPFAMQQVTDLLARLTQNS